MTNHNAPAGKYMPDKQLHLVARTVKAVGRSGKWCLAGVLPPITTICRLLGLVALWNLLRSFPGRVHRYFQERNPAADGAPDMEQFEEVLRCWGVDPDEASIHRVIRGLWLRCAFSCGMALVFLWLLYVNWMGRVTQLMAVVASVTLFAVSLATHLWRIRVLSARQFTPFTRWITGRR